MNYSFIWETSCNHFKWKESFYSIPLAHIERHMAYLLHWKNFKIEIRTVLQSIVMLTNVKIDKFGKYLISYTLVKVWNYAFTWNVITNSLNPRPWSLLIGLLYFSHRHMDAFSLCIQTLKYAFPMYNTKATKTVNQPSRQT